MMNDSRSADVERTSPAVSRAGSAERPSLRLCGSSDLAPTDGNGHTAGQGAGSGTGRSAGGGTGRGARGLFGAQSVSRRVHADPLLGLATLRAHLLQALHPVAAAGLRDHSRDGSDIWDRTHRTAEYVTIVTFGSCSQVLTVTSRLRAVHARVEGVADDGRPYRADDPPLLVWAHSCLVASFLELTTRGGLRLTGQEQDSYISEQVRSATLLGLEPDVVPRDRASLLEYFRAQRPTLACTSVARQDASALMSPRPCRPSGGTPSPPWADRATLALAALPGWARRLYAQALRDGRQPPPSDDVSAALRALRTDLHG
jgi:uncharacterized protein (DUF2236 family)